MAVKIRLKKSSETAKKRYHFRIIITNRTSARDARSLDEIGYYDPSKNPPLLNVNDKRLNFWLKRGATPTDTVRSLLKKLKKEK